MNKILDKVDSPKQLKQLSLIQLNKLAGEIRELIIRTIAENGGHLAPSLGVVELTLALHTVFDCPEDKFIWDVGHQSYVHKILTGRRDAFSTIRTQGGLSGFPKRSESPYDSFGTGHSSTSISAALGMAIARDLSKKNNYVVAVIGDGSMTGGQAFEALNHAGDLGKHLIVILNDNEMSIDKNVGALSEYLSTMRTAPTYNKVKHDLEFLLKKIPTIGESVAKVVERLKDSLRFLLVPGELFEELGFKYVGPIDGHNIELMREVLEKAKTMQGPILIHTLTRKGKGYLPAECESDKFHGVGPFCIETGEIIKKTTNKPTYTSVFSKVLIELAKENKNIVAITAAMPEGTGLKKFGEIYPDRFLDVGIAEQHAVTVAAGLACEGKQPIIALYSTFAQRAYDQILHDVCLQKLPVVFALDRAGIVGEDGPTHHGVFDYSYLRHIPNLTIMAPKDENELKDMLATAFSLRTPVVIRYPRGNGLGVEVKTEYQHIPVGMSEEISIGSDVMFLAVGAMVDSCVEAVNLLKEKNVSAGVINARFIKPLDERMIEVLAKTVKYIVTIEDNMLAGGFGSAVLEALNEREFCDTKVLRLGYPDKFIEQGKRENLLELYKLTPAHIAARTYAFIRNIEVR
ncbi:1-deoxy-D-xylulose-5-phosphate synthase [Anaerosinus gibii]|uniref:1-deoxy-D-xylulose-5-phosphate synthase n=1 Tax=Selenobaculum gibii TaxID=3054208 RepID=A0A9Y2AGS9_9FIRM|nr:1-deoxy-D-xylulose-5-phosphate synthase [Selenobaculum gbiensis]WIW69668.1 1-deoxy-D-xylulose-5-phosphate synthase [Selenobaculum gbiensis]